ncbi:MAG: hypothetical protein HQ567_00875 [Candidatus Nealsonbacteria bacterium]|nr:hypothetical protein [Candidatus Nealsonbacteria bacterium]
MKKGSFGSRRRELEEKFFQERDKQLLQAMREKTAAAQRRKALIEVSGITDEELLDQLDELDIGTETIAALSLFPLVAVAWADGSIDEKERQAIIAAAEQKGMEKDHPGHELLDHWLQKKPDPSLMTAWKDYVSALYQTLSDPAKATLKAGALGRARAVAAAAGGLLGFGNKVSKTEQAVLDELEQALE